MPILPPGLTDSVAAAAVIIAIVLFLRELRIMGKSRDEERNKFLELLDEKDKRARDTIEDLVALAHTMVSRCQAGVPEHSRVTTAEVTAAAKQTKGEDGNGIA